MPNKWYYDDKVQMILNTYWPNRRWFWARWDYKNHEYIEGKYSLADPSKTT